MLINGKKELSRLLIAGSLLFFLVFHCALASEITKENVIRLVNDSRSALGLGKVIENTDLSSAAEEKAKDMIENDYFAHTSPQGVTPWDWIEKNDYYFDYAGENLAIDFTQAEDQHQAWMTSLDHRRNILNEKYREIGVAVEKGLISGHQALVTVQLFGTKKDYPATRASLAKFESKRVATKDVKNNFQPPKMVAGQSVVAKNQNWATRENLLGSLSLMVIELSLVFNLLLILIALANPVWRRKHLQAI